QQRHVGPAEQPRGACRVLGGQVGRRSEDRAFDVFRPEAVGVLERAQQLGRRVEDRCARVRRRRGGAAQSTQSLGHGPRRSVALDGAHGCRAPQGARPRSGVPPHVPPPPGFLLGISVGTPAEAERVRTWGEGGADYWSVGPCFATGNKPDAGAPLGAEGFARLARLAPAGTPVIAIGGISAANAAAVARAGAAGIAVIGAVWGASDATSAARALRAAFP